MHAAYALAKQRHSSMPALDCGIAIGVHVLAHHRARAVHVIHAPGLRRLKLDIRPVGALSASLPYPLPDKVLARLPADCTLDADRSDGSTYAGYEHSQSCRDGSICVSSNHALASGDQPANMPAGPASAVTVAAQRWLRMA